MSKIWLVRAGSDAELFAEFRKRNYISIGYALIEDLRNASLENTVNACRDANPEARDQEISNWVWQIRQFLAEIQMYDHILTPSKDPTKFLHGLVAALRPEFVPGESDGHCHPHRRQVLWHPTLLQTNKQQLIALGVWGHRGTIMPIDPAAMKLLNLDGYD